MPGVVGSDFAARAFKFSGTSRAEELAVTEVYDSACRAAGLGGGVGLGIGGGTRLVAYAAGPGEEFAFRSDGCVGGGRNCWDGLGLAFGRGGFELMADHTWEQQLSAVGLHGFRESVYEGPASYSRDGMLLSTPCNIVGACLSASAPVYGRRRPGACFRTDAHWQPLRPTLWSRMTIQVFVENKAVYA